MRDYLLTQGEEHIHQMDSASPSVIFDYFLSNVGQVAKVKMTCLCDLRAMPFVKIKCTLPSMNQSYFGYGMGFGGSPLSGEIQLYYS